MIRRFQDATTEDIFHGVNSRSARKIPHQLWQAAARKLDMLNAAHELGDLMVPPGNRLEALKGNLKGYHSIRINDQYRIIFMWSNGNVEDVKIADYHG